MAPYSPTSSRFHFPSPRRPSAPLFLLIFVVFLGIFTFTVPTDQHREWAAAQLSGWGDKEAFAQEPAAKVGMEEIEWIEEVPETREPVVEELEVESLREELDKLDKEEKEVPSEEVRPLDEVVEDVLLLDEEEEELASPAAAEEETALPPPPPPASPTRPLPKCNRTMLFHFAGSSSPSLRLSLS